MFNNLFFTNPLKMLRSTSVLDANQLTHKWFVFPPQKINGVNAASLLLANIKQNMFNKFI